MNSDKDNKAGFKQVDRTGAKVTRQLSLADARLDGALNASLLQDESALIRLWGLRRCRNRCPVICVIPGSRSASLWRFLNRHDITFEKKPASSGATPSRRGPHAAALDSSSRLSRYDATSLYR
jgi:hypothetical protein